MPQDEAPAADSATPTPTAPQPNAPDIAVAQREEEAARVLALMRERFPNSPPCPFCGKDDFSVSSVVVLPPRIGGLFSGVAYPVFQIICSNCGYTQFFNAVIAGLLPDPNKPEPEQT